MTLADWYNRQVPEYSDTLYMDGYSPEQILFAARRSIYDDLEQEEAQEPIGIILKSEVKVK